MNKMTKMMAIFLLWIVSSSAVWAEVTIYLTRHGKTMFNTVHRVQGWSDTPLTEAGVEVAKQLGRGLEEVDFVATYASDLGRARETAKIVLTEKGVTPTIIESDQLRETCFGIFEGDLDLTMWTLAAKQLGYNSFEEVIQAFDQREITIEQMMNAIAAVDSSGQAEDYQTVNQRMTQALAAIAQEVEAQGGGQVLVVSHGMAISAFLNELVDPKPNSQLANASVTKVHYSDDGQITIEAIGDMSYVEKGKLGND